MVKKIQRFKRLNELLRCHQGYTILDLMAYLNVGERTIRKDLEQIQLPPYNAVFWNKFRGKERLYRYKDINYTMPLFEENDELKKKLNAAIDAVKQFKGTPQFEWLKLCLMAIEDECIMGIGGIMSFENNAELIGIEHLASLSDAIANKYPVKLTYRPYYAEERVLYVHPYHLKQYNNRWFLIGKLEDKETLQNYAIDRIHNVEHLSKPYIESDIDFDEYFEDIIGVSISDSPIETIELMVNKSRYPYIETKPLHWSQKHIKENDLEETVYLTINVKVNKELISTLLSYGSDIEVVAPQSLRSLINEIIKNMYNIYKSDGDGK